jgi:AcrR family transcriptional regulator
VRIAVPSGGEKRRATDSAELRPLHGGRHSISRDLVAHSQRERLLSGLAGAVAEHGYNAATISQVTDLAAVSRRTFYENFDSKEACFLATYEALDDYVASRLAEAASAQSEWPLKVAAALTELVSILASHPEFARVYLVEAPAVGRAAMPLRDRTIERFVELLEPGRTYASDHEPAAGIEEALVGGITTQLARTSLVADADAMRQSSRAVIEFALSPYLGRDVAREVATAEL